MSDDRRIVARAVDAIATLRQLRERMRVIGHGYSPDLGRDLVTARRDLANHLTTLDAALDALVAAREPDRRQAFRDMFSQMRHRLALHQANWPAIRINEDVPAYIASANHAREIEEQMLDWMDRLIADWRHSTS